MFIRKSIFFRKSNATSHRRKPVRPKSLEQLEKRIMFDADWQNPTRREDVNGDLLISPSDALNVINTLNDSTFDRVLRSRTNKLAPYIDTNGDGRLSPTDALLIINFLNDPDEFPNRPTPRTEGRFSPAPFGFISMGVGQLPTGVNQVLQLSTQLNIGREEFNEMGVFVMDGPSGAVNGVLPSSSLYAQEVFNQGQRRVLYSRFDVLRTTRETVLPAGAYLGAYVLQGSTDNGDAAKHLKAEQLGATSFRVGWEEHSTGSTAFDDSIVTISAGAPTSSFSLVETKAFVAQQDLKIALGQAAGLREVKFKINANFDSTDKTSLLKDTLAVYVVDPSTAGTTLLDRGEPGTAIFTLSEDGANYVPGLVRFDGDVVTIDVSSLAPRTEGLLRFQLLNGDLDNGTTIQIVDLSNSVDAAAKSPPFLSLGLQAQSPGPAVTDLTEYTTTSAVNVRVSNVRFDTATRTYAADLSLVNSGPSLGSKALVSLANLPVGVSVSNASGTQTDPYINFANAISSGGLVSAGVSNPIRVNFTNPKFLLWAPKATALSGGPNVAPTIPAIANLTMFAGGVQTIELPQTDADGDTVTYSIAANGSLPTITLGKSLVISPKPNQIGQHTFDLIASDGVLSARRTITVNVQADPNVSTRVSGQVLDVDGTALVGLKVEIGAVQGLTDSQGRFTLSLGNGLPAADTLKLRGELLPGAAKYPFIAEKLPLVLEHAIFAGVNNVIARPIYLPKIDIANGVVVKPTEDTLVSSSALPGVSVQVKAGTLMNQQSTLFNGVMSITEVPTQLTPAALPGNLFPDMVITIQPGEMVFTAPAPLTFPNRAGWAPGSPMDLWSINPVTGEFEIVGEMEVSADGQTIETISGGIRNSSWHFPAPSPPEPVPVKDNDKNEDDECEECKAKKNIASEVSLHAGTLTETHTTVAYQSLGTSRAVTLTYDSKRADPRPIISLGFDNVTFANKMFATLEISHGDLTMQVPGSSDSVGLEDCGLVSEFCRYVGIPRNGHYWRLAGNSSVALQADLSSLPSGRYTYTAAQGLYTIADEFDIFSNRPSFTGTASESTAKLTSINSINSPLGAGWGMNGLLEIIENPDGSVLLVDGTNELVFEPNLQAARQYHSPPGDFSKLEKLQDGSYQRTDLEQTKQLFGIDGKIRSISDRLGNTTTYRYDSQGRLTTVVDPVGLETTFSYAGPRLSSITDPAGRVTSFTHDSSGNLIRITDPDGTFRSFEYDGLHHMVAEVDQRGVREEVRFGFHGRVTEIHRKDGSKVLLDALQTQGLLPPDQTIDPRAGRLADSIPASDAIASISDGMGNVERIRLDKAGQERWATDGVGVRQTSERNSDNLVSKSIDARGNETSYSYDSRGNVVNIVDDLSQAQSISVGQINKPGEVVTYKFSLASRKSLYFDTLSSNNSIFWSLVGPTGELANRTFSNSDFFEPLIDAVPGDYSLTIDAFGDTTGEFRFRVLDLSSAALLTVDSDVSGVLSPDSETDLYRFNATAGDRFFFDVLDIGNSFNAGWRLFDPFGNSLFVTSLTDVGPLAVAQSGTYTLAVEGGSVEGDLPTYSFNVRFLNNVPPQSPTGTGLVLGATTNGSIAIPGEEDRFIFSLTERKLLHFDSLVDSDLLSWKLEGPSGELSNRFFNNSDQFWSAMEAVPGSYVLTVEGSGDATGAYSFRLQDLAGAVPLTPGSPASGSLSPAMETDLYRFNAIAGDRFFFDLQASDGTSNTSWQLFDPYGNSVFQRFLSDVDTQVLLNTGSYTLVVEGSRFDSGNPTYTINVQPVVVESPQVLSLNATTTGEIDVPGESHTFNFSLADRKLLYLDSLTDNGSLTWNLVGPSGELARRSFTSDQYQPVLDAVPGQYRLTVDGDSDAIGAFAFQLWDLSAATVLTPGNALSGTLSPASQSNLYRFNATAGGRYYFDLQASDGTFNSSWQLFDPLGNSVFQSYLSDVDTKVLSVPGSYTLVVEGSRFDSGSPTYTINVQPVLTAQPTALTLNGIVSGRIDVTGEQKKFTFSLSERKSLYLDSLTDSNSLNWSLIGPSGELASRTFNSSDQFQPLMDAPPGLYELTVDGNGDAIGDFSFRLLDIASASSITPGSVVNGELNPISETNLYRFDAVAGDRFFFDVLTNEGAFNARWRLFDPAGFVMFDSGLGDVDTQSLSLTGRYTIAVEGSQFDPDAATYSFNVQFVENIPPQTPVGTALTLGSTTTGAISVAGESDVFRFSLDERKLLHIESLMNSGTMIWKLEGPRGFVDNRSLDNNNQFQPVLDLVAGNYTLTVEDSGDATGGYSFRVRDLAAASLITPGSTVGGTFSPSFETDIYRFSANAGEQFFFDLLTNPNASSARWRLFDSYGNSVFEQGLGDVDTIAMPNTGTYILIVAGSPSDTENPAYSMVVRPVAVTASQTLSLNQTTSGQVSVPGESDAYTFSLSERKLLYLDSLTDIDFVDWTLRGPSGIVTSNSLSSSDQFLPVFDAAPGQYRLTIDGSGDATGAYSFRLLDLASATLFTPGTSVNGDLSPVGQSDLYRFNATAGDRFFFDVLATEGTSSTRWRLFDPYGNSLFSSGLSDEDTRTLAVSGSYTLAIEGSRFDEGTPTYSFNVQPVTNAAPKPLSIRPIGQFLTYDSAFNQLTSYTDDLGRRTLYDIDPSNGNTKSVSEVVGVEGGGDDVVTRYTYTTLGQVDTAVDALGRVTDNDYDARGRRTSVTYAKGTIDEAIVRYEYDLAGNISAMIDANGNRTTYTFDAMNRVTRITQADPDGAGPLTAPVTNLTYDQRGNLIRTVDATGSEERRVYDAQERLIKSIDALGKETLFEYDAVGNLIAVIDPLGQRTVNRYDARKRLVETIDPDGGSTKFSYDLDDNLVSLTDPVGNKTQFGYDSRSRQVSEIDPLGKASTREYDLADNLLEKTDRNGRVTQYTYDDLDRVTAETWVGGGNLIQYAYDAVSNLTSVTDVYSELRFTYDSRNRVKSADNSGTPNARSVLLSYTYDDAGNVLSVSDNIDGNSGGLTGYSYDALNRMSRVTQNGNGIADKRVDLAYNAVGQFASINRFSNLAGTQLVVGSTYAYDALNRLTSLRHSNASDTLAFYDYLYDSDSRITRITDVDGVTNYSYDDRDQLIGANHSNAAKPDETYEYDANGNRVNSSIHGNGYVTGPGNRLLSDGIYNYAYDNEGNLLKRTEITTGNYRDFVWDFRNRLVAVIDKTAAGVPTQEVEFSYDGFDRRVSKSVDQTPQNSVDAAIMTFVYDREDVILDYLDSDGAGPEDPVLDKRYLHGPGIDQVMAQDDGVGSGLWYLTDHLGSLRGVVDQSGVLVNTISYNSYGQMTSQTNPSVISRFGFTGRELDKEIEAYFFRARYYSVDAGRFVSEDTIGFAGLDVNLFRYVHNSPVNAIDPSGNNAISCATSDPEVKPITTTEKKKRRRDPLTDADDRIYRKLLEKIYKEVQRDPSKAGWYRIELESGTREVNIQPIALESSAEEKIRA